MSVACCVQLEPPLLENQMCPRGPTVQPSKLHTTPPKRNLGDRFQLEVPRQGLPPEEPLCTTTLLEDK